MYSLRSFLPWGSVGFFGGGGGGIVRFACRLCTWSDTKVSQVFSSEHDDGRSACQDMCLPVPDSDLVASEPFDQYLDMNFNRDTYIRIHTYKYRRAGNLFICYFSLQP